MGLSPTCYRAPQAQCGKDRWIPMIARSASLYAAVYKRYYVGHLCEYLSVRIHIEGLLHKTKQLRTVGLQKSANHATVMTGQSVHTFVCSLHLLSSSCCQKWNYIYIYICICLAETTLSLLRRRALTWNRHEQAQIVCIYTTTWFCYCCCCPRWNRSRDYGRRPKDPRPSAVLLR